MEASNEYRISIIVFEGDHVNIKTWWTSEDKYALLDAALGEPDVDSIYPRDYINSSAENAIQEGVHVVREDEDD
jgi:hypothetical protein